MVGVRSAFVLATSIVALLAALPHASAAAVFTPLGSLPIGPGVLIGWTFNYPLAISADGSTVVGVGGDYRDPRPRESYGALQWRSGVVTYLGDLPGGEARSTATGVSGDGSIIVGTVEGPDGTEAALWRNGVLGPLHGATGFANQYSSGPKGVSIDGRVVVGQTGAGGYLNTQPFLWRNGTYTPLGYLHPLAFQFGAAFATSSDGKVVVGGTANSYTVEAFRWKNGVMTGLGFINDACCISSQARAVSADGTVIVGFSGIGGSSFEAALWRDGSVRGLGDLEGGAFNSGANGVSANGQRIVGYGESASGLEAVVWEGSDAPRRIIEVLSEDYGLNLAGWRLEQATAITPSGDRILGFGINPQGLREGWIATVPEPNANTAVMIGFLISLLLRSTMRMHNGGSSSKIVR